MFRGFALFARTIVAADRASQWCCGIEVGCWLDIPVLTTGHRVGSRNVLEVLGRVLLIGWSQRRTPRMGFFAARYAKFKGMTTPFQKCKVSFSEWLYSHSMRDLSLNVCLGFLIGPSDLVTKRYFQVKSWWISNEVHPHCFILIGFAQRFWCFFNQKPCGTTTGLLKCLAPPPDIPSKGAQVVLSVFALCHCWQVPYSNGFRNDMLGNQRFPGLFKGCPFQKMNGFHANKLSVRVRFPLDLKFLPLK